METNCLHKHQFTPVNYTIHFATFQSLVVKTFLILDNGPIITTFCWKICGKTWPNSKAIVQHTAEYDYIDIDLMSAWSFFFHAKASPILDDIHDILRTQSSHDQFICSNYRYIITTFVQIPILIMIKVHSRNFIIAMQSQTSTILSI